MKQTGKINSTRLALKQNSYPIDSLVLFLHMKIMNLIIFQIIRHI